MAKEKEKKGERERKKIENQQNLQNTNLYCKKLQVSIIFLKSKNIDQIKISINP